jgi:hypothetical protein
MQTRRGRIENGAVVLADPNGVPEGAEVTVLIGRPEAPVDVSDEELREIDAGLAEAQSGQRIDARALLRELRRNR